MSRVLCAFKSVVVRIANETPLVNARMKIKRGL